MTFIPYTVIGLMWLSVILLALFFSSRVYYRFYNPNLVVTFFDVGQGDAIFFETPSGNQILIDGGKMLLSDLGVVPDVVIPE